MMRCVEIDDELNNTYIIDGLQDEYDGSKELSDYKYNSDVPTKNDFNGKFENDLMVMNLKF